MSLFRRANSSPHLLSLGLCLFATQHLAADPSVVINEFKNTPDVVELLVITNGLNMQGMIVKDYSSSGGNDNGGGYSFSANALWSSIPAGTLIVLRPDSATVDVTVGGSDYNLDVGLQNTNFFVVESGTYNIAQEEIVQIKAAGSGKAGTAGAIHSFASSTAGTAAQFTASPNPKLRTIAGNTATGEVAAALNPTQSLADFDGTNTLADITVDTLGTWNNTNNQTYILSLRAGGPASNQPPALAAISDVNVAESNSVIFLVHATNVDAADDVTLWATNLPPGAVFDPTNALGSVSNLFSWTSASPTGTYVSTFFAADKDGTNSDSVTFTVYPAGIASDLIISEYGHSSGNNKFIEIYNGLSIPVNLSSYAIRLQRNGATNVGNFEGSFALSGTLAPNRNFVIVHSLAASALLKSKANLLSSTSPMDFSGNDPVQLLKLGNPVDIVGPLSDFSNWGQNQILRRKSYVLSPSTNYIPADWDQISQTDWSNVGLHTMDGQPAQSGYPPTLDPISPQIVTVGSDLQFNVTALDALDGDLITLSATSLPAGALFPTVTNAASVTGTLIWSNTTPVGVYTSSFAAVDQHGTNTLAVQITVTPIFPSNQSIIVHFNEVRFNDSGDTNAADNKEFVELIGHAGTNLAGCVLIHYTGTAGTDADVWTYTFPSFVIPDDGILDTNGHALGFVVLAQPDGLIAGSADLLLPSIGATVPRPSLQNNVQGLVLYDPSGKALDAVAWGSFGTPGDTGDLLIDDPGPNFITQTGSPQQPHYLHQMPYSSDDNTPQAPDNVIGDSGANWQVLNATPGALNNIQTSGNIILEPFVLIVPPPTGLLILVR